jgi:hypothetical protein
MNCYGIRTKVTGTPSSRVTTHKHQSMKPIRSSSPWASHATRAWVNAKRKQLGDFRQDEPKLLRLPNEADPVCGLLVVAPITVARTRRLRY